MPLAITAYNWLKACHVLASVLWVGGGGILVLLATMTLRENEPERLAKLAVQIATIGQRMFAPLSVLVLALGIGMIEQGSFGWTYHEFWVDFGLAIWAISALTGTFFLGPESARLGKLVLERGANDPDVQARITRILAVARVDSGLLLLAVFDMAAKPFL